MRNVNFLSSKGIDVEKGLELLGDMEMYEEILSDFLDQSSERLDNLSKFKETNDLANYSILVHAIKGDSKYLGFDKLAELAFQHEIESKNNNLEFINDNYNELLKEFKIIIGVIQLYLDQ